jgi:hypothetical protein
MNLTDRKLASLARQHEGSLEYVARSRRREQQKKKTIKRAILGFLALAGGTAIYKIITG